MDVYSVLYSPAARDDLFGVYSYIATELLEPEIAPYPPLSATGKEFFSPKLSALPAAF